MATYEVGDVNEAQLLEALLNFSADGNSNDYVGMRTRDIAQSLNWSINRVREVLKILIIEGKVEAQEIRIRGIHGGLSRSIAYSLVKEQDGKEKKSIE